MKKTSHERWNRVVPIPCYSHLFVIVIIHLLFPCRSHRIQFAMPALTSWLRKTGTIWKQNWHHCKQWNHMRVDWILIERSLIMRAHILSYCECSRYVDGLIPREHHTYWQSTTKNSLKRIYHKRHYWLRNTAHDANTGELDNGLYTPDIYMSDETTEPTVDDSDREPCSLARHGIPAHCSCRLRMPTMTLSVARFVRQASVHSQSLNQN